jgi:hypothetical protein
VRRQFLGTILTSVALFAGCGGSGAAPSPKVTRIEVTSIADFLLVGANETFTATITRDDGSSSPLPPGATWGTDAAGVATVDGSSGNVVGVGPGAVTVFVDYQGARGAKPLRVIPVFQGGWSGAWIKRTCSESGGFVQSGFCDAVSGGALAMTFSQTRDRVEGTVVIGDASVPVSGSVAVAGSLAIEGTATVGVAKFAIGAWSSQVSGTSQTGAFTLTIAVLDVAGQAQIGVDLSNVTRASGTPQRRASSADSLHAALAARGWSR